MKQQGQSSKLFTATGDRSDVVLNWYGQSIDKLDLYADAYRSAAQSLIEKSSEDQLRDIGACPVVFLYRLSLELSLKAVLISGAKILEHSGEPFTEVETILGKSHNLSELLKELKALYRQLDWTWDAELEGFGKLIREFQERDPKASYFRYPVKMKGEPALERDFSFDLRNFSELMDKMLEFLDGIDCGLAGLLDQMQEAALDGY